MNTPLDTPAPLARSCTDEAPLCFGRAGLLGCGGEATDSHAGETSSGSASTGGPLVCAPGKTEACPCPGGAQGAQTCNAAGSGWQECQCGSTNGSGGNAPTTSSATSSSSSASSGQGGSGGNEACVPKTCQDLTDEYNNTKTPNMMLSTSCGIADDGCGGEVDCGGCSAFGQMCEGYLRVFTGAALNITKPNVCGKSCVKSGVDQWCDSLSRLRLFGLLKHMSTQIISECLL